MIILQQACQLCTLKMVCQIKDKAEIFKIPNFGGIPNVYFGKPANDEASPLIFNIGN